MRRKLNYQQRRKLNEKRQNQREINDAISTCDELPECQICFKPLTTSTKVKLQCNHDYYCTDCMTEWYGKSQVDNQVVILTINDSPEFLKFPVYFNNSGVLKCPTCRCEHAPFHRGCKTGVFEPKLVIARVHFNDLFDRNPVFPITCIEEFNCLIPRKYQNNEPISILNPLTNKKQEIPNPMQFIMMNILGGVENGDTDFYMRHVPKPLFEDKYTVLVSDMVITSKWCEDLNNDFSTFRMFDVTELSSYYKTD